MKRWLLLAMTLLLGFSILFAIDNYYREQIRQENSYQQMATLEIAKKSLEEGVDQRILLVEGLRAFMGAFPTIPDQETFDRYAATVLPYSPEVRALQYVDTQHNIRYIYPLEGNKAALNLDLMTRPALPFLEKAIETKKTTVSHPTVTVQGSLSVVARSPIFDGNQYLGAVQGVIDITSLLEEVSRTFASQYDVVLKDANGNVFWESATPLINPLTSTVQVGDNSWELELGWIRSEPQPQLYILGLIWGLGGALVFTILFTINETFRRIDWLSTAVEKKTADLTRSERRYRTLIEAADDVILLTDLEGCILFYNSAYYTSLGFNEDEAMDHEWFARVHPDDEPILKKQLNNLLDKGKQSAEYRVRHKDGHWIHRYSRFNLIKDEQGKPQSILVIIRDITERKRTEEAAKFQAHLLNTVEQAVIATDLEGKITFWNKYAETLYGWSAAEVIGQNILEVTSSQATQKQASEIMADLKEGKSWSGEFLVQGKDSSNFLALVTNAPVHDEKGELVGIVGISSDVTQQKWIEKESKRKDELLKMTGNIARIGGWEFDAQTSEGSWTDEVAHIHDLAPEQLTNVETGLRFYEAESLENIKKSIEEAIELAKPFDLELELVTAKGQHKWVRILGLPITKKGKVKKVRGTIQDITERKRLAKDRKKLEKQFYQAQKMQAIGQLTAGIAHDFNNLLTIIKLNTELAQRQLESDNSLFKKTENILQASLRAENLVSQLLIYSRKQIGTPKIVDPNELLMGISKMMERMIGERIEVELNLDPYLWPIKVDSSQFEQAVVNLMVNARDAMPEGGKLVLETANIVIDEAYMAKQLELHTGEYVLLTVSDTGKGMSKKVRERLFEPFFTTKEVGKGTGLGLAMVYGFVKQSQGHIWVYSEKDTGSIFKIYLPRASEVMEPTAVSYPQKSLVQGEGTILLVEDDSDIREVVGEGLKKQGYKVLEAKDGHHALLVSALHTGPIHLLLTDVVMPKMSGLELAEKMKDLFPQLKVIYMSGYSYEMISHHGILESGVNLLQKPFSYIDLIHRVQEILG